MNLPPPVQAYFDADERNDGDAVAQAFVPGAVVRDEHRAHVGRDAIEAWWRDAKSNAQYSNAVLDSRIDGDTTEVRARVSGQFPGSPVMLTFVFRTRQDGIVALEIGA